MERFFSTLNSVIPAAQLAALKQRGSGYAQRMRCTLFMLDARTKASMTLFLWTER